MNDQWPPPAPDINSAFSSAHDAKNDNVPHPIVTKKQVQDLDKQRKKPSAQRDLKPPGMRATLTIDQTRNARIEKMKQRLQRNKGKARDDFNRSH